MIRFLVGEKGAGKSKRLIEAANEKSKTADGHLVFITRDKRYMYDLNHKVRYVETANFPLTNYREFIGFICGILSQDNDIEEIFVLGYAKVVREVDNESLLKLIKKLENLSKANEVDFTISLTANVDELPEEIRGFVA